MKPSFFLIAVMAGAAVWIACGSDTNSEIFASDAGSAETGAAGQTDGSAVTDGASNTPGLTDGSSFTDAMPAITKDGGATDNATPGGDTAQVACGAASCKIGTEFCCAYQTNNGPPDFYFACASGSTCPAVSGAKDPTALTCSAQANCASGTVCCLTDDGSTISSACIAPSACVNGNGADRAQLCDPAAASTGCPTQDPCDNANVGDWGLPDGFATCGGKGT